MTGRVLSHFEILEKLGQGGMGVVYKARDTLLNRLVAIKVLPPGRVADTERRKRFIHEARSASALNHPNIITIYEISQAEGVDFIAMEYVEGRTLDQMVPKTGMRIHEALRYAVEIAGALERAHAEGIVHRDLKPSNIMVATDGRLKILDFGLAKLTEIAVPGEDEATLTAARLADVPHTEEGGIVGTVAYMSPEQAEGKPVDARSDIFSFGSVLYEMISGRRAFKGETRMSTMAAVLREEPTPLAQLVPGVPREVEKLVVRCLRKDSQRRAQHMSDLRLALEELKEESDSGLSLPGAAPPVLPKHRRWVIPAVAIALLALAGLGAVTTYRWRRGSYGEPKLIPLTSYEGLESGPALSPDGRQVAFVWDGDKEQNFDIYVKLVDAGNPIRLTRYPDRDLAPAWSPDGRFLVFTRLGLSQGYYVIPALGGPERKVADILKVSTQAGPPGADWMGDSKTLVIVDSSLDPPALAQIAVDSSEKKRLTSPPATSLGDFHPRVSPDGQQLAFLRVQDPAVADWFTLRLDQAGSSQPTRVSSGLVTSSRAAWSADSQSLIVSALINGANRLGRIGLSGQAPAEPLAAVGTDAYGPSISPLGNRLAYVHQFGDINLWRADLEKRNALPVRIVASSGAEIHPSFSPDGARIVYSSTRSGPPELWIAGVDGSDAVQITNNIALAPGWSPDGRRIAYTGRPSGTPDIYVVGAEGGKPTRLTTNPANDSSPSWSRDGRGIYFSSNRTGRYEIWRTPADGSGGEVQVTHNGGLSSCESLDGKALYYRKFEQAGLFYLPLGGGGTEERIADVEAAWELHARGVYYFRRKQQVLTVQRLDLSTRRDTTVLTLPSDTALFARLTVSPDGRWLVFGRVDQQVSDLMLLDNFR